MAVDLDERQLPGEAADAYVIRLARAKAEAGRAAMDAAVPVLGADTTVVLDGEVLGKPSDAADAGRMLRRLSGREHLVMSAVTLLRSDGVGNALSTSRVRFREIREDELRGYCESGEPMGKAGAYAIQGRAAVFVSHLDGSYSGVMGLPLFETAALLAEAGIDVLADA